MSNLLQKASIITTPTAYDTGKILSVKPVQYYGPELVTNGDFATDSDWTKGTGWNISGGKGNGTSASGDLTQTISIAINKTYRVNYTISNYSSGVFRIVLGAYVAGTNRAANGTYTDVLTVTNANSNSLLYLAADISAFTGSIDNVSVKEVLNADFDFTRNSSATRVGSNGLIQDVASNLPRIDYTGGVGSWKFEPQRTNSILQSNQFDTTWTLSNASVVGNQSGIYNTTDAWKLVGNGANNDKVLQNVASGTSTFSIYAKAGNSNFSVISLGNGFAYYNIETGVVTSSSGVVSTNIESIGNGWYRLSITVALTSSSNVQVYIASADGSVVTNNGDFIYLQHAQLEVGSYATSIIPTQGSATTRSADAANNAGSSDLINSTEGVLYAEISALADDFANYKFISIYDGTYNNFCDIYYGDASNRISARFRSGGGSVINMFFAVSDVTASNKVAISWKANEFKFFINGVSRGLNTSGATPVGLNKLDFHQVSNSNPFYGNTKCVGVFKEALTDLELECLSSWMSFSDMGIALGYTVE